MRKLIVPAALAATLAVAAVPVAGASTASSSKSRTVTVKVGDYFFAPGRKTVRRGTTFRWVWPKTGGDTHDVALDKGPRGVRTFQSDLASSDYSYRKKLTKRGSYTIICSLHPEDMILKVKVK